MFGKSVPLKCKHRVTLKSTDFQTPFGGREGRGQGGYVGERGTALLPDDSMFLACMTPSLAWNAADSDMPSSSGWSFAA